MRNVDWRACGALAFIVGVFAFCVLGCKLPFDSGLQVEQQQGNGQATGRTEELGQDLSDSAAAMTKAAAGVQKTADEGRKKDGEGKFSETWQQLGFFAGYMKRGGEALALKEQTIQRLQGDLATERANRVADQARIRSLEKKVEDGQQSVSRPAQQANTWLAFVATIGLGLGIYLMIRKADSSLMVASGSVIVACILVTQAWQVGEDVRPVLKWSLVSLAVIGVGWIAWRLYTREHALRENAKLLDAVKPLELKAGGTVKDAVKSAAPSYQRGSTQKIVAEIRGKKAEVSRT